MEVISKKLFLKKLKLADATLMFSEKIALYFKITDQLQRTLALSRLIQKQLNVLIDCGYGRGRVQYANC